MATRRHPRAKNLTAHGAIIGVTLILLASSANAALVPVSNTQDMASYGKKAGKNGSNKVKLSFANLEAGNRAAAMPTMGASRDSNNPQPIPIPTAAWLFGTALIGLTIVSRRRTLQKQRDAQAG